MNQTVLVAAAVLLLAPALPARAQSPLAEAAQREAARRQAVRAASVPVYTSDDLARLPARAVLTPPRPAATEVTTVGVAGSASADETAPEARAAAQPAVAAAAVVARDEKHWRDRITQARSNLSRAEIFAESLESRINALTTDVINRDDPAQRQHLSEQRQRALDELARVKGEIAAFMKQIAGIEDEARRLGVPPGWLR